MSKYEWEKGEVKIPAREWRGFKEGVRGAHDRQQELARELAGAVYEAITREGRGKRGFDYQAAARTELNRKIEGPAYRGRWQMLGTANRYQSLDTERDTILISLFPKGEDQRKPVKPKAKDFPKAGRKVSVFQAGEGRIALDDSTRTFIWNVPENNRACERAHEYAIAAATFAALDKIKWTRGTGGMITGNDEYNRESEHEGGGRNYVNYRFGPLGNAREFTAFTGRRGRRISARTA